MTYVNTAVRTYLSCTPDGVHTRVWAVFQTLPPCEESGTETTAITGFTELSSCSHNQNTTRDNHVTIAQHMRNNTITSQEVLASSPGRFFANITAGEKYGLVLIVYGRVGCDCKFNSKTCRKTIIVKFNENTDK